MIKQDESGSKEGSHLPLNTLLTGTFASGVVYALLLNTAEGRKWSQQHNWFTVVVGVFMTLGWLAIHDSKAAGRAFVFFVASGLPIVGRALLQASQERAELEKAVSRGN